MARPAVAEPSEVATATAKQALATQKVAPSLALAKAKSVAPAAVSDSNPRPLHLSEALFNETGLELSNGAGRERLARDTADALADKGVKVRRLTNHAHYRVQQTEIHYRGATHLVTAQALAQAMAVPVVLVESTALRGDINVKVLMGADAARRVADAMPLIQPFASVAVAAKH